MPSTAAPISLHRPNRLHQPLAQRLWSRLRDMLAIWRAQHRDRALQRATARSLRGLSEQTLRDIGMQGRVPLLDERQSLFDRHPGRW